ncbi:uncharacterized protein LOC128039797 [Gossypium raimondii]|uniref:uncharacterized protein LOC128039797 n=1 Tax=Gossypium raimondii TaxID=29730 RepID=UPI00227BB2D3|nr:uncharacterized protein LOC128039797 [Gossypium raimondii]
MVNDIRLLGEHFDEARIVEKVLSTLSERYEAKISSLEDSRDLATISLTELINTFYAQEQRRASRAEDHQEGAFNAKAREASSFKAARGKRPWKNSLRSTSEGVMTSPADIARGQVIQKTDAGLGQMQYANTARRRAMLKGSKVEARVAEDKSDQEEQSFLLSRLAARKKCSKGRSLGGGCTNHMSPDASLFKTLDEVIKPRSRLEMLNRRERLFIVFKDKQCHIIDPSGSSLMTITMTDKCFEVHWANDSNSKIHTSVDDSKLWHQRLGHANFRSMARMAKEGLARTSPLDGA